MTKRQTFARDWIPEAAGPITVSGHTVDSSVGAGGDAKSRVYFVGASSGTGSISNISYLGDGPEENTVPANKIITAFESDVDDVTVTLEMHILSDAWQPDDVQLSLPGATTQTVTRNSWTQLVTNVRIYTAQLTFPDAGTSGTITATLDDGDTSTCEYTRGLDPPEVLTIHWEDQGATVYPALQTQFKDGDTMSMSGTCQSHADEIYIKAESGSATQNRGLQGPFAVTSGVWGPVNVIAGDDDNAAATVTAYCNVTGGVNGPDFESTETVECDQTHSTFTPAPTAYPGGREAIKLAESATITILINNNVAGNTYLYSCPVSPVQTVIGSPTTYVISKSVTIAPAFKDAAGGDGYADDDDPDNVELEVTRTTKNGMVDTHTVMVEIADATPELTVNTFSSQDGSNKRLRIDDGTNNYVDHNIRVVCDQKIRSSVISGFEPIEDPAPVGTWQGGAWSQQSDKEFRRDLRIAYSDYLPGGQGPNSYNWTGVAVTWTNRADIETTTIATNDAFTIGGFANRTLTHDIAPDHEMKIDGTDDVIIVNTAKLVAVNTSKGGSPQQTFEANVTEHNDANPDNNNFFTITDNGDSYVADGRYYHNSDNKFANTVSVFGSAVIDIEEIP